MLNLFRMNVYRLLRSKSVYICLGILVFTHVLAYLLLYVLTNPAATYFLSQNELIIGDVVADGQMELANSPFLEIFRQASIAGGAFACFAGIVSSLFICSDFSSGFIKNMVCAHENKWDYILSKICSLCLLNFVYLAVAFVTTLFFNILFAGFFSYSSLADTGFYLFTIWMLQNGFSSLILLISVLTRNIGAAITGVLILCGGVIVSLLHALLGLFGFEWLMEHTLYYSMYSLPVSPDGGYNWTACLTGLFFVFVYTLLSKIVLSKRDL